MKLIKLIETIRVLEEIRDEKLPFSTGYKMAKFLSAVSDDDAYFKERYSSLISEYAVKDGNGNLQVSNDSITISPDKIEEFNKKVEELGNVEVEIPDVKFSLSELDSLNLSVNQIVSLFQFIEE